MATDRYVRQLAQIIDQADLTFLLIGSEHLSLIADSFPSCRVKAIDGVAGGSLSEAAFPLEDEPVFVQYSSGSTLEPRGCILTETAIATQLSLLEHVLDIDAERDLFVAWLPLSHDMGMFGCLLLTAYWTGTPLVLSTPQRFINGPQSWFADCAQFGATMSCAPNFALELAARTARLLGGETIPMRRLVVGGEPVDLGTLRRACAALGPERLSWRALLPAYGLAETVLAVTISPVAGVDGIRALRQRCRISRSARQTVFSSASCSRLDVMSLTGVGA